MESDHVYFFFTYFSHIAILCFSLALIYLNRRQKTPNLPPGKKGLPFIGETLSYVLASSRGTPEKFFNDRTTRYSTDVFRTSLLGATDMAVFCGAAGNKFLFTGQNKYVTSWWPESLKKVLLDPSSTDVSPLEEGAKLRTYLMQFLRPDSLQKYIPVMDAMAKDHLKTEWSPFDQVKVFPLSKKYTFALACRLFMSVEDAAGVEAFAKPFSMVTAGLFSVPINLPGTTFNRAVRGGRMLREKLIAIIKRKKEELDGAAPPVATDMVTCMLLDGMTVVEVANKVVGFFIASHDTASTAITFLISYLADYADVYHKVLEEQREVLKGKCEGELLNWSDIEKMKYTWCVVCEVMRLSPPTNGAFKEAITDFTYGGYTIPKGWKAFWSVHTTHKNPEYFPEPHRFDPSRFEGGGPPPYTFVPFGGGPRMCPGKEYTRLEILCFIHNLITRFKWNKTHPNESISYIPSPVPQRGLPVSLKPHPFASPAQAISAS